MDRFEQTANLTSDILDSDYPKELAHYLSG